MTQIFYIKSKAGSYTDENIKMTNRICRKWSM